MSFCKFLVLYKDESIKIYFFKFLSVYGQYLKHIELLNAFYQYICIVSLQCRLFMQCFFSIFSLFAYLLNCFCLFRVLLLFFCFCFLVYLFTCLLVLLLFFYLVRSIGSFKSLFIYLFMALLVCFFYILLLFTYLFIHVFI